MHFREKDSLAIGLKNSNSLVLVKHVPITGATLVFTGDLHDINVTDGYRYGLKVALKKDNVIVKVYFPFLTNISSGICAICMGNKSNTKYIPITTSQNVYYSDKWRCVALE